MGTTDSKEATEALPVEVGQAGRGRHQVVKGVVKAGRVGRRGRLQGDAGQGVGALADVGGSPTLAAEGDTGDLGLVADPQHIEMVRSWFLQQYHMLTPIHEKSCLAYENPGESISPDFLYIFRWFSAFSNYKSTFLHYKYLFILSCHIKCRISGCRFFRNMER